MDTMDSKKLEKYKRKLYSTGAMFGGMIRRNAVKRLSEDASPEAIHLLAEAVGNSDDIQIRELALSHLRTLTDQRCIDAICDVWMGNHDDSLAKAIMDKGCAPRDKAQRALFFFLTEQWEKYEGLDFDGGTMGVIYKTADDSLQRQIREKAIKGGKPEVIKALTGGREGRRLGEMTDSEWEDTLSLLDSQKKYADLWFLALMAPPVWGVRMMRLLRESGWHPDQDENRKFLDEVLGLAGRVKDDEPITISSHALEGHTDAILALSMSPDGRLLASGGYDRAIHLWSLPEGKPPKTLEGHTAVVTSLAISPDSQFLISGSADHTVRLWELPEGEPLKTLEGHTGCVNALSISSDSAFASGKAAIGQSASGGFQKAIY